jgi:hypothetical protein
MHRGFFIFLIDKFNPDVIYKSNVKKGPEYIYVNPFADTSFNRCGWVFPNGQQRSSLFSETL